MAAVDGWVNDVEDVLSKAESAYRQITQDTSLENAVGRVKKTCICIVFR